MIIVSVSIVFNPLISCVLCAIAYNSITLSSNARAVECTTSEEILDDRAGSCRKHHTCHPWKTNNFGPDLLFLKHEGRILRYCRDAKNFTLLVSHSQASILATEQEER